jgi:hypothetical protein
LISFIVDLEELVVPVVESATGIGSSVFEALTGTG